MLARDLGRDDQCADSDGATSGVLCLATCITYSSVKWQQSISLLIIKLHLTATNSQHERE